MEFPYVLDNIGRCKGMMGGGKEAYALVDQTSWAWIWFARSAIPNHRSLFHWPEEIINGEGLPNGMGLKNQHKS